MKKAIIALALSGFAASSFAAYEESAQTLQWQGTVPAATVAPDAGYVIKQVGTTPLLGGTMDFTNIGGEIALNTSSKLSFDVLKDDNKDGVIADGEGAKLAYNLTLTNVKLGKNDAAPAEQVDGFFKINLNDAHLAKDTVTAIAADAASSIFEVASDATVTTTLQANDKVVLQAVLAVAPQEI